MQPTTTPTTAAPFIFVQGSALLDVVSTLEDTAHPLGVYGTTQLGFGGVGYNIAINLKVLGSRVTLMSSMNRGPLAQMILAELKSFNIRSHIWFDDTLPDGIYCGHFKHGEEGNFVCCNPDELVPVADDFIARGMANAACAIACCSFETSSLNAMIRLANKQKIPFFLSGVGPKMALRVAELRGKIDYIFLNKREVDTLVQYRGDLYQTWHDVAKRHHATLVVTQGAQGVSVISPHGAQTHYPVTQKDVNGNAFGAGDLFMAGMVHNHFTLYMPLPQALHQAVEKVADILTRRDANIGTLNPFEVHINATIDKAHRDALTGVFNRHGIEQYIAARNLKRETIHALLIDVDFFKKINDTHGHAVGDEVLQSVAQILTDHVRYGDVVGRWGGEEFVCLLTGLDLSGALDVAERIRSHIAAHVHGSAAVRATVSIGVSSIAEGDVFRTFLNRADVALYQAKEQGRNRVVCASGAQN